MPGEQQPLLEFPLRFNLRDLGGIPTSEGARLRRGRIYRGASLNELGAGERQRFRELGVRTLIDLRTRTEFEHPEYPPLPDFPTRNLPLFEELPDLSEVPDDVPTMMSELYLSVLEVGAASIAAALELLADPECYPAAFFCSAGKDRTGVLAAIVLGIAGVDPEEIVRDYVLTDATMDAQLQWVAENDPDRWDVVHVSVYRAHAETMAKFLAEVGRRYGGIAGYLREVGVPDEVNAAVVSNLVS